MTAPETPSDQKNKTTRRLLAPLLIAAVVVLLIVAARIGFPSGAGGVHRDPAETAPVEPAHQ
jgi:hypothetical protein